MLFVFLLNILYYEVFLTHRTLKNLRMKKLINYQSKLTVIAILFAAAGMLSNCSKVSDNIDSTTGNPAGSNTTSAGPGANEVWIQGMAFNPSSITVTAGTKITWTNKDGIAHTVTSDTGVFDSGSIGADGTFSFTFTTAGTYPYHCKIHTSMTAKVVVN